MAYVTTVVYSESSQNEMTPQGPKLHLLGPMQILTPMFIPSMFSFGVLVGIQDFKIDSPHTLRLTFNSPKEDEAAAVDTGDFSIPAQQKNPNLPVDMEGLMTNVDLRNVPIRHEGEYYLEVIFDGEPLGKFPIKVKAVEKK